MSQVFISYSRKDIDVVRQLAKDLENSGFNTWWDTTNLAGGDTWARTIQQALRASEYCIVVLSSDAVESVWVEKEYTYAIGLHIKVIPILYKTCEVPMALANIHYIDFRGKKYKAGLQNLLNVLKTGKSSTLNLTPTKQTLKATILAGLRDPIWQMIGVVIAIITLGWGVYTFYIDREPIISRETPTSNPTAAAIAQTPTNTPKPATSTPTKIPPTPTRTPSPTSQPATSTPTKILPTPTRTPTPRPQPATSTPTKIPSPTATQIPTNTPLPPISTPTPQFQVPDGKALFVFDNGTAKDMNIEIGSYLLEVPPNQIGQIAIDPGTYKWKATSWDGEYRLWNRESGGTEFEVTLASGEVYQRGAR